MIAELGRIHDQQAIRDLYRNKWTNRWLLKLSKMIKENITSLNINRMKGTVDVEKDLDDDDGIICLVHL